VKISNRLKAPSISTRAQFDGCVDDLARTLVVLRKLEARRDEKLQAIRAEWEPSVREAGARVEALTLLVEKYAEEHREELLPGKVKSGETSLAVFGFRLGNPTLKLLNKQCSWEGVVLACKALKLFDFIRKFEEPDKDKIKTANLEPETLKALGVKIAQSEAFYVEPKDLPSALEAKAS
jgi:phage host-nuclease inhibitor protein Gam